MPSSDSTAPSTSARGVHRRPATVPRKYQSRMNAARTMPTRMIGGRLTRSAPRYDRGSPSTPDRPSRPRARGRDGRSGVEGDPRSYRGADRVSLPPIILVGIVLAAFILLWYFLGTVAGLLWTPRALVLGAVLSLLGIVGYRTTWALDAMLLGDALLVLLMWLDASLARSVVVTREPLPALPVGHSTEVTYRWTNPARRRARLTVREVRPEVLGGTQPARAVRIPARSAVRESVPVIGHRRGRESGSGGFVLDSLGPLGLGRHRIRLAWRGDVVVCPPIVSVRLRASVAEALRRREAGMKPVRQLGEGRIFESLREWVPGDDLRHIDWKATARRNKVITRQYEAERRQQVLLVL